MLFNCKLVKRGSPLDRVGIFTTNIIPKGKKFYKIPEDKILTHNHDHAAKISNNKYVWDEEVLNYVNHSCNPNSIINLIDLTLIAIRKIRANEEITCDYDFTEGEGGYNFICKCGDKRCRFQIGSVLNLDD